MISRESRRDALSPEEALPGLDLEQHLRDPAIKQRFVTTMFEVIAPRYDRFTRVFSYGMDRGWKRTLLAELANGLRPGSLVLDLACGTGDLTLGAATTTARPRVLGVDISHRMVAAARRRRGEPDVSDGVWLAAGHMPTLALRDGSVDAVTAGYALRNAPDYRAVLDEIKRVLKQGGRLLTLDFYRPQTPVWRRLFLGYLRLSGNLFGWLWHRQPVAYGYIASSIEHFVSWQEFSRALERRGFAVERVHRRLLGGICIHAARLSES
jgi:demethylmenaquinone methyltransferase/2-methoxy-6-polyprenyl-1,4-benzoquinol methylase